MYILLSEGENERSNADNVIYQKMKSFIYSRKDIVHIRFYTAFNQKIFTLNRSNEPNATDYINIASEDQIFAEIPFAEKLDSKSRQFISPSIDDGTLVKMSGTSLSKRQAFIFNQLIMDYSGTRRISILSMVFDTSSLDAQCKDLSLEDKECLLLLNEEKQLMYQKNGGKNYKGYINALQEVSFDSDKGICYMDMDEGLHLVVFSKTEDNPYILLKVTPIRLIYRGVWGSMIVNVVLSSVFILVFIVFIILISRQSAKPTQKLVEKMKQLEKGRFDVRMHDKTYDVHMSLLVDKFNSMAEEIDRLFNEKFRLQLAQKTAELKALQAQINPHFLYNTLQTVQYMALKRHAFEIQSIVNALGDILKYCLNYQNEVVTLGEEMEYVDKYLLIQGFKYNNLKVEVDFNKGVETVKVPKMILQPFVENCFIHGYHAEMDCFSINIRGFMEEGSVVMYVSDNGKGIHPQVLEELRTLFNGNNAENGRDWNEIGIRNVFTRLKIIYGEQASIDVESKPFEKTEFTIRIPAKREEDK